MAVETRTIALRTRGHCDVLDITEQVQNALLDTGLQNGLVMVFVPGSTGSVTTVEYEPGLEADLKTALDRLVPVGIPYQHDHRWADGNGHAHVRSALMGPSLTVPFVRGKMTLGTWQQIVFLDFDNCSRSRELVIQVLGE
ncbi:MAG: secondary thiamine-phosphate synthase enzyme YjbQ [Chloroflexi bacterium]|nr:secondary thiamine-phosphate synthase enzyme YjbQ [Chloroflexota bacterium]MBU1750648.1 secondary thiamine-phosphate synthase enzyme YjbQ [Chloroflexota bacterium]MBU1880376.1 secondary thiamine-phosphate synthase enzyme YjbQ [Chloroflexota bacterium]